MAPIPASLSPQVRRRNRVLGIGAAGFVGAMLGVSFAAVPLYRMFCAATGYGGTPQIGAAAAPGAGDTELTIRFAAFTHPGLPWSFAPDQPSVQLRVGAEGVAFYHAQNESAGPATGIATYNVTPDVVGRYFHKTACFCFEEQTLAAGQRADMPLSFWVDPEVARDPNTRHIRTITVSYTFFRTMEDAARAGALASAGPHVGAATTR